MEQNIIWVHPDLYINQIKQTKMIEKRFLRPTLPIDHNRHPSPPPLFPKVLSLQSLALCLSVCPSVCLCLSGCVPLGWSGSGSMIQDHSDHSASKEPVNPLCGWICRFLWCAMIRVILDHWSRSRSSQRNAPSASVFLSVCLPVCLSLSLSFCLCLCLSVCLSLSL